MCERESEQVRACDIGGGSQVTQARCLFDLVCPIHVWSSLWEAQKSACPKSYILCENFIFNTDECVVRFTSDFK